MSENPYHGPLSNDTDRPPIQAKRLIRLVPKVLIVLGIAGIVVALMLPAVRSAREPARRSQCMNQFKQIGLALRSNADRYGALPPAFTTDVDGKPLHSWRTMILPYMEEEQLYKSIDLTKPWDDPANAEALKTRVDAYHCPTLPNPGDRTIYLAVVTPNSSFRPTEPRNLSDITDPASATMMVVEVDLDHAVPWMAPIDADEDVLMGLGPQSKLAHHRGMYAAFVDGSVRFLTADMPTSQRRALVSIAGNDEAATDDWD